MVMMHEMHFERHFDVYGWTSNLPCKSVEKGCCTIDFWGTVRDVWLNRCCQKRVLKSWRQENKFGWICCHDCTHLTAASAVDNWAEYSSKCSQPYQMCIVRLFVFAVLTNHTVKSKYCQSIITLRSLLCDDHKRVKSPSSSASLVCGTFSACRGLPAPWWCTDPERAGWSTVLGQSPHDSWERPPSAVYESNRIPWGSPCPGAGAACAKTFYVLAKFFFSAVSACKLLWKLLQCHYPTPTKMYQAAKKWYFTSYYTCT